MEWGKCGKGVDSVGGCARIGVSALGEKMGLGNSGLVGRFVVFLSGEGANPIFLCTFAKKLQLWIY